MRIAHTFILPLRNIKKRNVTRRPCEEQSTKPKAISMNINWRLIFCLLLFCVVLVFFLSAVLLELRIPWKVEWFSSDTRFLLCFWICKKFFIFWPKSEYIMGLPERCTVSFYSFSAESILINRHISVKQVRVNSWWIEIVFHFQKFR